MNVWELMVTGRDLTPREGIEVVLTLLAISLLVCALIVLIYYLSNGGIEDIKEKRGKPKMTVKDLREIEKMINGAIEKNNNKNIPYGKTSPDMLEFMLGMANPKPKTDYEKMQDLAKKVLEENRVKEEKEAKDKELLSWAKMIAKDMK